MTHQSAPLLVNVIFYMLGIAVLLPWNFFITADSLWQYKLRNTSISEWPPPPSTPKTELQVSFTPILVIVSNASCFFFLFFTAVIVRSVGEKVRMMTSLSATLVSMVAVTVLTVVDSDQWQSTFFGSTLSLVALINLGEAVLQSSCLGLAGQFPPSCMVAFFSGVSVAGLISSVSFIVSIAVGGEDKPIISGLIYFIIADVTLLITIGLYIYLTKQTYYKNNIVLYVNKDDSMEEEMEKNSDEVGSESSIIEDDSFKTSAKHYWKVMKQVGWMAFDNGFTLLVTLAVFPSVMVYVTSTATPSAWTQVYFQPTITFLLFNFADFLGREVTRLVRWPGPESWLFHALCIGRVVFIPLVLLCHGENKTFYTLFDHDAYYIIINFLFGLTNGYFCTLTYIYYPSMVDRKDQELAGTLIAAVFGLMMTIGSATSPLFVMLWGPLTE